MIAFAFAALLPATASGAAQAGDPFYGTLYDDNRLLPRADRQTDMDSQVATGVGVIRVHVVWSEVEDAPGVFDWSYLDETMGDASDRGLSVLPVIYGTPQFYKPEGTTYSGQTPPEDPATYGRFLAAMATRYGRGGTFWCRHFYNTVCELTPRPIVSWQIWNEPNWPSWWKGDTTPDPPEYVSLLQAAYVSLKGVDPNAEVVAGGLSPTLSFGGYANYLQGLYDAGAAPYFDTLAFHAYGETEVQAADLTRDVRRIADQNSDTQTPIWITEYGWGSAGAAGPYTKTLNCQAALIHAATAQWRTLRDQLKLRGAVQFRWRDVETTNTSHWYRAGLNPATFGDPPKPSLGQFARAIAGQSPDPAYTLESGCPPSPVTEPPPAEPPPVDPPPAEPPPTASAPSAAQASPGATGRRAAALKRCAKKQSKSGKRRCRKRARSLPF